MIRSLLQGKRIKTLLWSFIQFTGWVNTNLDYEVGFRTAMTSPELEHAGDTLYLFSDLNWVEWSSESQSTSVRMRKPDGTLDESSRRERKAGFNALSTIPLTNLWKLSFLYGTTTDIL